MDNRSLIYNHNPMKKINPEDLVVGQKYLVEMELSEIDHDDPAPYCFGDIQGDGIWFPKSQPIYTHEELSFENVSMDGKPILQSSTDLEMLVNVASRLWETKPYPTWNDCIKASIEFITACKKALKEGER